MSHITITHPSGCVSGPHFLVQGKFQDPVQTVQAVLIRTSMNSPLVISGRSLPCRGNCWASAFSNVPSGLWILAAYELASANDQISIAAESLTVTVHPPKPARGQTTKGAGECTITYPQNNDTVDAQFFAWGFSTEDKMAANDKQTMTDSLSPDAKKYTGRVDLQPGCKNMTGTCMWVVSFDITTPCTNAFTLHIEDEDGNFDNKTGISVTGCT